jgi:heme/copper-type cytochrome/quinol oxidase subunit 2
MITRLRGKFTFLCAVLFAAPLLATSVTFAANNADINNSLCAGTNIQITTDPANNSCAKATDNAGTTANGLVKNIINILSAVVGILAVIMIIYAGFRYVTSGGSDEGVKAAKNTILYAIVGLVIVALAQLIVHFVINKTSQASSPCRHGHIQGGPSNGASC